MVSCEFLLYWKVICAFIHKDDESEETDGVDHRPSCAFEVHDKRASFMSCTISLFARISERDSSTSRSNSSAPAMTMSFLMMLTCVDDAGFSLAHVVHSPTLRWYVAVLIGASHVSQFSCVCTSRAYSTLTNMQQSHSMCCSFSTSFNWHDGQIVTFVIINTPCLV